MVAFPRAVIAFCNLVHCFSTLSLTFPSSLLKLSNLKVAPQSLVKRQRRDETKACDGSQTKRLHTVNFQIVFCQNFINPFGPPVPAKTSFAVVPGHGQFSKLGSLKASTARKKSSMRSIQLMSCQERNGSHVISVRGVRLLVLCFNQS